MSLTGTIALIIFAIVDFISKGKVLKEILYPMSLIFLVSWIIFIVLSVVTLFL